MFFQVYQLLSFDNASYLSRLFQFILSSRLIRSLFVATIELIILLHTFLVISFYWYREQKICQIFFKDTLEAPGDFKNKRVKIITIIGNNSKKKGVKGTKACIFWTFIKYPIKWYKMCTLFSFESSKLQ